ncbi:MAG TPA: DinB family protein [Candidatus Limnocylindrales bacterium]
MSEPGAGSIRPFYADWAGYNRRIIDAVARMTSDDLALQAPGTEHWPIWAICGHMAGTRVFWLCDVFGEAGIEQTPWPNGTLGPGWEDDLSVPRSAEELVWALTSTWQVIEGLLGRWTPDSMDMTAQRNKAGRAPEIHTRQSILLRMITHEGYHVGEINIALGAAGREQIDPWPGREWQADAPRSLREGGS